MKFQPSNFTPTLIGTAVATGTILALQTSPALAFSFTTNKMGNDPKGDIWLQSIELEDGTTIDDFSFINHAQIVSNDEYTGGNTGAASADIGDNATTGLKKEHLSESEIFVNLANKNLNNIIDTEDNGHFAIDLFFDKAIDNLLIWERGMNSKLGVQALDFDGNLIGNYLEVNSREWNYAGYKIDTKEIGGSQKVSALGVSMADLGVENSYITGFRFFSQSNFNGPDWKILGTDVTRGGEVPLEPESVPEPGMMAGLLAVSSLLTFSRRRNPR
ncbi:MAG: PEP-CTERM sorting domain-containing protein [Cyanobacteria bacterium SID2]|nr:PEP-CTERM sorting domain-containing protein [Cyanobacteria bacterium SID2]MBP0003209.1 PEP-CTERM sorting domain-containing protein [Cyanobacteria bacterium SBC]